MSKYRGNAAAIRDLVRDTEVHRDLYIDEEVFQLEMEHLFANTWVYVGHDSQVPNEGDYFGNTGKFFRCPYHAWTFRTDGTLRQIPLAKGYEGAKLEESHAAAGMNPVKHVHNYRGFVFAKLNDVGLGFEEFFGESL